MIQLLGPMTLVGIVTLIVAIMLPIRPLTKLFIAIMPLTTVAVFQIGNSTVQLYQLVWIIWILKNPFRNHRNLKLSVDLVYVPLMVIAVISLLITPRANVNVIGQDGQYGPASESAQQIVQIAHLAIALTTATGMALLCKAKTVSLTDIVRATTAGAIIVIVIGYMQLILPAKIITDTVRNATNVLFIKDADRISSTFGEPSFLAAYLIPIAAMHLVIFTRTKRRLSLVVVLSAVVFTIQNGSTSGLLGITATAIVFATYWFRSNNSRSNIGRKFARRQVLIIVAFILLAGILASFAPPVSQTINKAIMTISGANSSGSTRIQNMEITWRAFLSSPLIGLGWGVSRCESLLLTLLSNVGIIGLVAYIAPLYISCKNLIRSGRYMCKSVALSICINQIILFVSVPELYFLPIWTLIGGGLSLSMQPDTTKKELKLPSNSNELKFSIILPCYKISEKRLQNTIESVIRQHNRAWELICIDDNGPGKERELVHKVLQPYLFDNRIRLIDNISNKGAGAARNNGISVADGEWLAFIDADDQWDASYLDRVSEAISEEKPDITSTDYYISNGRGERRYRTKQTTGKLYPQELFCDCLSCPSCVCVKRELVIEVGGFDETLPSREDYDLWLRIIQANPDTVVSFLHEPLAVIDRDGHESVSSSYLRNIEGTKLVLDKIMRFSNLDERNREEVFVSHQRQICKEMLINGDDGGLKAELSKLSIRQSLLYRALCPFVHLVPSIRCQIKKFLYR